MQGRGDRRQRAQDRAAHLPDAEEAEALQAVQAPPGGRAHQAALDDARRRLPRRASRRRHRTADAVPGVRGVLDTIKRPVKTSGVGVEPGRIAPRLAKGSVPVALGSPLS